MTGDVMVVVGVEDRPQARDDVGVGCGDVVLKLLSTTLLSFDL